MNSRAGIIASHQPHEVTCAWNGCVEKVIIRSPRNVAYCPNHRQKAKKLNERLSQKRIASGDYRERKVASKEYSGALKNKTSSPCNNCAFLKACQVIVKKNNPIDPYCFTDSKYFHLYLKKYPQRIEMRSAA